MVSSRPTQLKGFDAFPIALGDELRGERATLGKSLLDVQRDLKIKAAYIAAIEDTDLAVFPNMGFVAGYVRSYARYLGLPPEDIYRRFCAESGFAGVNAELKGAMPTSRRKPAAQKTSVGTLSVTDETLNRSRFGTNPQRILPEVREALSGLGSLAILILLIIGLGFGGWQVLREIQRVEVSTLAEFDPPTLTDPPLSVSEGPTQDIPQDQRNAALSALYGLSEDPPPVEPRLAPISQIDPDAVVDPISENPVETLSVAVSASVIPTAVTPTVEIVAAQPAWVRITDAGGASIFEKILETGERYYVPGDVDGAQLRAGNSGSVYLVVGPVVYGPLGSGPRVARDVSLNIADIADRWPIAPQDAAIHAILLNTPTDTSPQTAQR